MYPSLTSCTPDEARKQMAHLFAIPDKPPPKPLLETGGKGRAYLKVWRAKPFALFLWFFFEPGTDSETVAHERGVQAMTENEGVSWAVSVRCTKACARLPVVGEAPRAEEGPSKTQRRVLLEMLNGEPRCFQFKQANTGRALKKHGWVEHVKGLPRSAFTMVITDAGRKVVGK